MDRLYHEKMQLATWLCYSTYDRLELKYKCNCGSQGSALLAFEDSNIGKDCNDELVIIKNRFCCPKDVVKYQWKRKQ